MQMLGLRTGAAFLALLTMTACGSPRSVEAFCQTLEREKAAFLAKYDERIHDVSSAGEGDFGALLMGLASGLESLGDADVIFRKLSEVAPEEIRADMEVISESMSTQRQAQQVKDVFKNPLGTLASGIAGGLMSAGSWRRVESYIEANC